jgi:hypothetical protein
MEMGALLTEAQAAEVAAASETGIRRGMELLEWWNSGSRPPFDSLPAGLPAGAKAESFFSTTELDGHSSSVMGCIQDAVFLPAPDAARPESTLGAWVSANFIQKTHWSHPGSLPGGFLYRPALVKAADGTVQAVDAEMQVNLADIGSQYQWLTARLDVLDYMKAFRTIGRFDRWLRPFNKETGYMVFHPVFSQSPDRVPPGCVEELRFGYAVVPLIVLPTFVAYGPGRFYSAMKQYRILVRDDGAVTIRISFLVAPRTEKVMNFGGWDPIYGTVGLLNAVTLGTTKILPNAHDRIDRYGLGHHARVHHSLLEGLRPVWTGSSWVAAERVPERTAKA